MTLKLDTWFKVTAHSLHKGTLCVKYESDWAKGVDDILQTSNLGQTDERKDGLKNERTERQTDKLISIGRPQSWALIENIC